jgi:hypothetical protein
MVTAPLARREERGSAMIDTLVAVGILAIGLLVMHGFMQAKPSGNAAQELSFVLSQVQEAHLRAIQQNIPQTVNFTPQANGTTIVQTFYGRPGGGNLPNGTPSYISYAAPRTLTETITTNLAGAVSTTPFSIVAMTDGSLIIGITATIAAATSAPACQTAPLPMLTFNVIGTNTGAALPTYTIDCAGGRLVPPNLTINPVTGKTEQAITAQ